MTNLGAIFFPRGIGTPHQLLSLAAELEQAGMDHLFMVEGGNDALTVLSALALRTERATIGSGIANIYIRHPYALALAAAVVESLSNGRLVLGLGTAHQVTNVQGLGLSMEKPLTRMREYVAVVRALLTPGASRADIRTERYQATGVVNAWPPQRPVPIILAALGFGSVRLAAQVADGVILSLATREQITRIRQTLNEEAARVGRDGRQLRIYAIVNTVVRARREEALPLLRAAVAGYLRMPFYQRQLAENGVTITDGTISDTDLERLGIAGTLEQAREGIAAFREAGADVLLLSPGAGEPDQPAAYRAFTRLLT